MKLRRLIVLFSSIGIATLALTRGASGQSKDERAIRAAGEAWQRWVVAQNVDSIVALHTPDAVVMMANSPPMKGSAAIRGGWGEMVKTPGLNLRWTPTRIDVVSPRVATEYGTYTDSWDGPNGRQSDAGSYVTIWHKVNGKWRVALDAPVSSMAAAPAAPPEATTFVARSGSALTWGDFGPTGFPPGAKRSVLSGDPTKPGPFVFRLNFPDGYQVPLHWHPTSENVTIISGGVNFGMGNTRDMSATQAYGAGDFVFIPARHAHYLTARGATVLQVSGTGPFQVNLGAPK
jgi:ketosteroid isomerase-like protein/quercetin dioxygenase-like cupin family protein